MSAPASSTPPRADTLGHFWWIAAVVILLVAAGLSFFASVSPDGLEWTAEHLGFADAAGDSAVAHLPFADYAFAGVSHPFAANAIAGVVGVLVVLGVTFGLTRLLARRR